jgi:hypothetical protein
MAYHRTIPVPAAERSVERPNVIRKRGDITADVTLW